MKKITPSALVALKDTLSIIYYYKRDFETFVRQTVKEPAILGRLNFDDLKRNTASLVVDLLVKDDNRHQPTLLNLMSEVARMDDFAHLERLDDGKQKAKAARDAVAALRRVLKPHEDEVREQEKISERRKVAQDAVRHAQGVVDKLREMKAELVKVVMPMEPKQRGFHLETVLRELFDLFDLDPKASFRIEGEQIDGAFTFDNTDYLLSAKWEKELIGIEDLDAFAGKISRKLENTLGLFISINGFSPTGVDAHCKMRPTMLLMDGQDLMAVLEGRIPLDELILRKRRHASQKGSIFLTIAEILAGK